MAASLIKLVDGVQKSVDEIVQFLQRPNQNTDIISASEFLLRQIPGHIAVRDPSHYRKLLAADGFAVRSCRFLPSDYPLFGAIDRLLAPLPGIGDFFRFRICLVAGKS